MPAIPFAQGLASGLNQLSGASPMFTNFIADPAGALRVRPGVATWDDFPSDAGSTTAVIGIYAWRQYVVYVTADRKLWAMPVAGSVVALSDATASTQLDGTGRPIFTFDADRVVIAGGGQMQAWYGTGLSERLSPTAVSPSGSLLIASHIAYSGQRFVVNVNDVSGVIQWTDPGVTNHTTWPIVGANYAEAETSPDPTVAIYTTANELFAFGTGTLQVYVPDPQIAFGTASSVALGCSARYSIINTDAEFAWLDDTHRFVSSSGRKFAVLSSPGMAATVAAIPNVSDCWGARIRIGPWDLLTWTFADDKRTLYYERVTKKWGEFRGTNENGEWIGWPVQSYWFWPERNLHLVGLEDGTIGILSMDALTDVTNDIQAVARTGFQDYGTFTRKVCQRAQVQLQRGLTSPQATVVPRVELRHRDGLGAWSPVDALSLGAADYEPVIDRWVLGEYRQRQWELRFTNAGEFVMTGATESLIMSTS